MSSSARRKVLAKNTKKSWRLERERRNSTWTQRKTKSQTYCPTSR